MTKKLIPIIVTSIQEISQENAFESSILCNCCKTISRMVNDSGLCAFCFKKIEQFNNIKVFNFKPCYYLFIKIGIQKTIMEEIETEQTNIGLFTNYMEYSPNNMIWYVYRDADPKELFTKVEEMYNLFKQTGLFDKSFYKLNIEKTRSLFFNKNKFICIGFNFAELSDDNYLSASFFDKERIFL